MAHADLFSAFFLHLLTPISFRPFSIQSNHLQFGLPAFFLSFSFPRNNFFIVLSSDALTRWPAHSSLLTFIVLQFLATNYHSIIPPLPHLIPTYPNVWYPQPARAKSQPVFKVHALSHLMFKQCYVFYDTVYNLCKLLPSKQIQVSTINIEPTWLLHFFVNVPVSIRGSVEPRTVEHTACRICCHGCQLARYLRYSPQISTIAVPQSKVLHNMINTGEMPFHVFELNVLLPVPLLQHHNALIQRS
jgi:hypothetical protein